MSYRSVRDGDLSQHVDAPERAQSSRISTCACVAARAVHAQPVAVSLRSHPIYPMLSLAPYIPRQQLLCSSLLYLCSCTHLPSAGGLGQVKTTICLCIESRNRGPSVGRAQRDEGCARRVCSAIAVCGARAWAIEPAGTSTRTTDAGTIDLELSAPAAREFGSTICPCSLCAARA